MYFHSNQNKDADSAAVLLQLIFTFVMLMINSFIIRSVITLKKWS